ncbi:MAG: TatD family hydrolase, partial [Bacteroidetes bacterium]|nr:TatD family hydrolase [Bacteroidota bacterium]
MKLVDTHTHLYSPEFQNDIDLVIQRGLDNNVEKFFLPAVDSTSLQSMLQLEKRFPGKCISMIGLHPCSVKDNYKEELKLVEGLLTQRRFAAVGEIGLDFYWDKTFT